MTSAARQTCAPIRAAAIVPHRRVARPAAIRMSVRPLPARQPGRALIVLRVRNFVPGAALPATIAPLGPGGLPRFDKRVLFVGRKPTAPRPENLTHHCSRILPGAECRRLKFIEDRWRTTPWTAASVSSSDASDAGRRWLERHFDDVEASGGQLEPGHCLTATQQTPPTPSSTVMPCFVFWEPVQAHPPEWARACLYPTEG